MMKEADAGQDTKARSTKLEPNRTNLSSLPAMREPQRQPALTAPSPQRICSSCGADDVVHRVEGSREPNDAPTEEHSVTIDIHFLKSAAEFTPRMRAKGWRLKKFQGRDAIERFICRICLIGQREMQREHKRKIDQELRAQQAGDSYYLAVCGE